jgi:ribosomal protein S18 acetylase RimI-like enzyme
MACSFSDLSLRETVTPADIAAVGDLVAGTGFFTREEIGIARELVEERLANGVASGYLFLLAEAPDGLMGYACYGPTDADPAVFDLYWIAVRNSCRGQGLGSDLMRATEERIKQQGGRRVLIETSSQPLYDPTRRFYAKHGYHLVETRADHYAPGDDCLVYAKELAA